MRIWLIVGPITRRFAKYSIVGITGTLTYTATLIVLVEIFHQNPLLSSIIGFLFTVILSYYLNYHWTFRSNHLHSFALPRYAIVSSLGMILNTAIMYVTLNILGWWYLLGLLGAIMVIPVTNFLLNYYWSFKAVEGGLN